MTYVVHPSILGTKILKDPLYICEYACPVTPSWEASLQLLPPREYEWQQLVTGPSQFWCLVYGTPSHWRSELLLHGWHYKPAMKMCFCSICLPWEELFSICILLLLLISLVTLAFLLRLERWDMHILKCKNKSQPISCNRNMQPLSSRESRCWTTVCQNKIQHKQPQMRSIFLLAPGSALPFPSPADLLMDIVILGQATG